jgi:PAS domain S-box-containing protein
VLCIADRRDRSFDDADLATLRQLGDQAAATLALRHRTLELYRAKRALTAAAKHVHELTQQAEALDHVSHDAFVIVNVDGIVRSVSPACRALFGYEPEDWVGRSALDVVHPDDLPTALVSLTETASHLGQARPIDLRLQVADGSFQRFQVTSTTFETGNGGHRVLMCVRDRPSATGLAAELDWYRSTLTTGLELSGDAVFLCDDRGAVRALTAQARAMHGSVERLSIIEWADRLGLRGADGIPLPLVQVPLHRALHGETVSDRYLLAGEDGTLGLVEARAACVRGTDDVELGAVMVLRPL